MFSESHGHLRNPSSIIIEQAKKAGVELILTAGSEISASKQAIQDAVKYNFVKACVGIHPWYADQYNENAACCLRKLANNDNVVAISEIGLDYFRRKTLKGNYVNEYLEKKIQRKTFLEQLRLAKELRLPVVIHDNTPDQEILDILRQEGNAEIGVVIHGFSKDVTYVQRCIDMGIYLSIGLRTMTAPLNKMFTEAIENIPLTCLMTETDSGNPADVVIVAEKIAELKGSSKFEVGKASTLNLKKLIKLKL